MAHKNTCKNAVLSERKRSDIFPPLGVPLCALDLQNAAFATEVKLKKTLKKRNGTLTYMQKCQLIQEKRN